MIPRISLHEHPGCCHPDKEKIWSWNQDNEGLFVIVHGLHGSPAFSSAIYKERIEKKHPGKYEVKVPYITKQGDCSLEDAAEPVLEMVKDYIEKNPGKPVNLIGTSNGGRIIGYIETHLREQDVHIRVTGLAGVFFGSDSMKTLAKTGIAGRLFSKPIARDLQTGSETAKKLITAMQQEVLKGSRAFKFYATNGDLQIPNFSSCLPLIEGAEYELTLGQDHVSLGSAVCDQVLQEHYQWMDSLK